jgi:hypothetical protein
MCCCSLPHQCTTLCSDKPATNLRIKQGVGRSASLVMEERTALTVVANFKAGSYDRVLRARKCLCKK